MWPDAPVTNTLMMSSSDPQPGALLGPGPRQPTIDVEDLSGNKCCIVGNQESERVRDVFRNGGPLNRLQGRDDADQLFAAHSSAVGAQSRDALRRDHAWCNRIDRHAGATEFVC